MADIKWEREKVKKWKREMFWGFDDRVTDSQTDNDQDQDLMLITENS